MPEKKDQFVIAYLTDITHSDAVISYAAYLSRMLHKGIILLHISDPTYTQLSPAEAGPQLQMLQQQLTAKESTNPLTDVTYAALKGDTKTIINALPTLLNAVIAVAQVDVNAKRKTPTHKKSVLHNFEECKIAFLTVQEPMLPESELKEVALSIDFKKESKEKIIWSSYFARFAGSNIHMLHYDYKDEGLRGKWVNNMKFISKFYQNLELTFTTPVLKNRNMFTDVSAIEFSNLNHYHLLIAVTTKEKDVAELIIGVQEERIIVNSYHIPVLFINPREDIYVLCD